MVKPLALLGRIHQLVLAGSQFIISTHSPILMAFPGAHLLSLDGPGIREVPYTETEHYTVTRTFLQDPARMLHALFTDPDHG